MKNVLQSVLVLALSTSIGITSVHAGGHRGKSHGKGHGKPFVAIHGALVEVQGAVTSLQDQIDLLVAKVDTVEERVDANQEAIDKLVSQNEALNTLIQQSLTDVASIEAEIYAIEQLNLVLQAQIEANAGDVTTLQAQFAENSALMTTLQGAIVLVQTDLISLETGLQEQIDNNLNLITALQDEINIINEAIVLKQNLINGICPNGEAMVEVLADGSVVCDSFGGATSGQLRSVRTYIPGVGVSGGSASTARAYCPSGYVATSAGIVNGASFKIIAMATDTDTAGQGQDFAFVTARNTGYNVASLMPVATCIQFAP